MRRFLVLLSVACASVTPGCAGCQGESFEREPIPEVVVDVSEAPAGCTVVRGGISPETAADLEPFRSEDCIWVDGEVRLREVDGLVDLSALRGLAQVNGGLVIGVNDELTSLDGLESLRRVSGMIRLFSNPRLEDLSALEGVEELMRFSIAGCPQVTSLPSFEKVSTIGSIAISDFEGAFPDDYFGSLERISSINIELSKMESLNGFSKLEVADSVLGLDRNSELQRIDAFPMLRIVGSQVDIFSNPKLPRCEAERILAGLEEEPDFMVRLSGLDDDATCD